MAMSEENTGASQTALPPQEGTVPRPIVRLAQVVPYVLTSQAQTVAVPALTQISGTGVANEQQLLNQGITRLISLTPSVGSIASLRPSQTNQSIVKALTKSSCTRPSQNVRLQLFTTTTATTNANDITQINQVNTIRSPVKRSLSTPEKKDTYSSKLQRVMNHRNVRSKIVKEKYNEHLIENYFLEIIKGNILDLHQFAKRPRTQHFIQYLKENAIDPKENNEQVPQTTTTPATPTATSANSLPGISQSNPIVVTTTQTPIVTSTVVMTDVANTKSIVNKVKTTSLTNSTPTNQEQIVEKAKQEAYVVQRVSDLQKEGLWSEKRLPKLQEMPRNKAHWDYLLEEMVWLAADFAQERKWKKAAAKKCARMVQKYFQDKALAAQKAEKAREQHTRKIAAFCAKEIRTFWSNVEKLVEYKQQTRLEEKRKKALDQQLSFIVDQTEKYSQLLAEGMNKSTMDNTQIISNASSPSPSRMNSDDEFQPDNQSSTDDEETIAQAEEGDPGEQKEEIEALKRESEMNFEDFLSELPKDYLENRDKIKLSDVESGSESDDDAEAKQQKTKNKKNLDEDFVIDTSNEEDDEDTINEQEKLENDLDHTEELDDLEAENNLSIEELRKKYASLPPINEDGFESENSQSTEEEEEENNETDDEVESSDDESHTSDEIFMSDDDKENEMGLQSLLEDSNTSQIVDGEDNQKTENDDDLINDAAKIAESLQPKGNTLSSTSVVTPVPFLLKLPLREYQHIGLDWLVTMFERKLNGILADEMGLGKTIQTIALLSHLACEKANWGPHLIIVPTSVMLNWEMECKKWCPGFKILTYYGTQKERKMKRTGWTKPNAFHICITSYKLVIQDHQSFRRKKWKYLILDEAQNIKNFKSQRWQLLLNFQTQQRLLLTGTPLQNNLMELWSLMHFLMPNVFQSHREFKEWFSNPVTGMIEGNSEYNETIIKRLHKVLRPFLLRRLKSEVEKQMPKKYEHIIMCRLSKRQRYLYDDYMSRAKTRETLASGNLLSVINVLMQLRKVCNHPNLFEVRPTISPFHCDGIVCHIPSVIYSALEYDPFKHIDLHSIRLNLLQMEMEYSAYHSYRLRRYRTPKKFIEEIYATPDTTMPPMPSARILMRVKKSAPQPPVSEPKEKEKEPVKPPTTSAIIQTSKIPSNVKVKMPQNVQFFHQGQIKAIPISTATVNSQGNISLGSILKPTDKITVPSGFAQLVQTSTGKHILLTPSTLNTSTITLSGPTTVLTPSGQKLTVLSKQPTNTIAKAVVKVQLTSVTTNTTPTIVPAIAAEKKVEENSNVRKTVGAKFIEQLYANQPSKEPDRLKENESPEKGYPHDLVPSSEEERQSKLRFLAKMNERRCLSLPIYGTDFVDTVNLQFTMTNRPWCNGHVLCANAQFNKTIPYVIDAMKAIIYNPERRLKQMKDIFNRFVFYVPPVQAPQPEIQVWHPSPSTYWREKHEQRELMQYLSKPATVLHPIISAMVTQFPDPRLIQYDCGKLQTLDKLLRKLKTEGHRALIFTQMTKMLDVLEAFLNFHGHIYLRLDGTTKVDQRQMLMERFNGDRRIFAFILSTRSGGIGVNLTGADTVIFYDSDWNPTMDAQAQDRCHRIGQTRDVHIYRLVSEKTIEENILKKANQKRLLGDLAIEGGNFTTAFFKTSTIQDLFNIDTSNESAANRMSEVIECQKEREKYIDENASNNDEKVAMGVLENALAACEDDQDVQAARTAKAEAVADLAEFDESIPLDEQEEKKETEISKAEQEVENLIKQLSPIERYAMRFIEETEAAWSVEQLEAAEREIEEQKREWEQNRLAAMREEAERRARELEEENDLLTFPREDATNQIWLSDNTSENMPLWCPPTPPQQDTDIYIDHTMTFLYDVNIMTESQLPPVYIKKDNKRTRNEAGLVDSRRAIKIQRKEDTVYAPRSLFERPSPALMKMRRELKLKYRALIKPTMPLTGVKMTTSSKPAVDPPCFHSWTIHEDMALLNVIQNYQRLPLNLMIVMAGHTPNWDFVADYVNTISVTYRSPKQCRNRYENVLMPREEGKQMYDVALARKKKNKNLYSKFPITKTPRFIKTAQLYAQDNNTTFSQLMIQRYDALKMIANKKTITTKTVLNTTGHKNPKHAAVLNECGIDLDHPVLPVEVAARRAERLARENREKKTVAAELVQAQRLQFAKSAITNAQTNVQTPSPSSSTAPVQVSTATQASTPQSTIVTTVITTVSTPSTPPSIPARQLLETLLKQKLSDTLRQQRIVASPLQTSSVVSVSGLSPAQLQAATSRLIVSGTTGQAKAVVGSTTITGKTLSTAQLQMLRQASIKQQQLRLQPGSLQAQAVKTTTVTLTGQPALQVQFTQAQPRTQYIRQGTVTVAGKEGMARTVTGNEMAQLFKRQQQLQQQKVLAAVAAGGTQTTTIQNITQQAFAQAIQQGGSSGTQVATLVKAVPSSGAPQTVTMTGVTLGTTAKVLTQGIKATNPQQIRQLHLQQQQLLTQKKFSQKLGIAQVGKSGVATQLIVGSKPLTMQQFQQVIRSPIQVQQGPVVLAKAAPRMIPVNAQGTKPTIQVVAATSQGVTTIRPQVSSTLQGALTGLKMQSGVSQQQQAQLSASFQYQNVGVRQNSPVRIQTSTGTPLVAVTVQSNTSNVQQGTSPQTNTNTERTNDQVSRFLKK